MDKATKTKIILFASLGIFVLVVLAVTLALTGKGDNREEDGSVIKLVTLQEMQLPGGMVINRGTAVFGVVKLAQDRINITVESCLLYTSRTVSSAGGIQGHPD